jgi:hypothetical protein
MRNLKKGLIKIVAQTKVTFDRQAFWVKQQVLQKPDFLYVRNANNEGG